MMGGERGVDRESSGKKNKGQTVRVGIRKRGPSLLL